MEFSLRKLQRIGSIAFGGGTVLRARSDATGKVVAGTNSADELVEVTICPATRRKEPTLPLHWRVRRIRYRMKGEKDQMLLTSLLDPKKYPANEIIALYHERWEIEMGFDELKTDMLERNVPMRSQTPQGVRQEL
jgi:IS4 transposase